MVFNAPVLHIGELALMVMDRIDHYLYLRRTIKMF